MSLARKVQLHWLDAPYSEAASLSCLIHMPADISISAFSCVLSFGSAAVKFCAQSARHQNANRRMVAERAVRLTMMVLSPPSASTAVTAPPSRLISSFCTGSTACETPPTTAKRHCQVKHKRVGVFWFRCSNNKVFQSRHQVQSDTQPKPQGVQRILATGLGLTPPGSLSRMRSLQPFSSQ